MTYKVYIIGEIPEKISVKCRQRFKNAKLLLENKGFTVFNPIDTLANKKIKIQDAKKSNFKQLIDCNAAYLLPSVSLKMGKNVELLLAIKLNMLIIQDSVYLGEDEEIDERKFIDVFRKQNEFTI